MDKAKERKAVEDKLKGVMEYYVRTYFKHYSRKIKDEVALRNTEIEIDILEARIDDHIGSLISEASEKFHVVAGLVLDHITAGREHKVREFELLFMDLVKRTLVNDIKEEKKRSAPIVIIADPNVNAEET